MGMTTIFCDICKKHIQGARKEINYSVILDKEICVPCGENLLEVTKRQMLTRSPYIFKEYNDSLIKNLTQMCAKSG